MFEHIWLFAAGQVVQAALFFAGLGFILKSGRFTIKKD